MKTENKIVNEETRKLWLAYARLAGAKRMWRCSRVAHYAAILVIPVLVFLGTAIGALLALAAAGFAWAGTLEFRRGAAWAREDYVEDWKRFLNSEACDLLRKFPTPLPPIPQEFVSATE